MADTKEKNTELREYADAVAASAVHQAVAPGSPFDATLRDIFIAYASGKDDLRPENEESVT